MCKVAGDETLIRRLLEDGAKRLANRHNLVLFTDGDASYASLFPEIFGAAYRPARQGDRGRLPVLHYRIPRTLAHVQIIKHREGSRVVETTIRYSHGSRTRVHQILRLLGYAKPNTSGSNVRLSPTACREDRREQMKPVRPRAIAGVWN
jgi:hypothetical protein